MILKGEEATPMVVRGSMEKYQTPHLKEHKSVAETAAQEEPEWEHFHQTKGKGKGDPTVQADSSNVKGQNFKLACS